MRINPDPDNHAAALVIAYVVYIICITVVLLDLYLWRPG